MNPGINPGALAPKSQMTRCVLYVEDHPVNVQVMQAIFTRRPDYHLIVATDGESGMEAARRLKPDLLLLDINLPDCRGDELLERMRELRGWKDLPAIAVTAERGFETDDTTFSEMWPKPVRLQDTLDSLDRLLLGSAAAKRNSTDLNIPPNHQPEVATRA